MNLKKKKILFVTTAAISFGFFKYEHKYTPEYNIIECSECGAVATYSNGLIYIGDNNFINNINNIKENDILIIDDRKKSESNIKIISSYKIDNKDLRNDILTVILEYTNLYPIEEWDRSIESMRLEWFIHNLLYDFNYEIERTKDVDFTSDEEDRYNNHILRKLFKL